MLRLKLLISHVIRSPFLSVTTSTFWAQAAGQSQTRTATVNKVKRAEPDISGCLQPIGDPRDQDSGRQRSRQ